MRASLLLAGILSATTVAAQTPKPEPVTTARMIVTVADHPSHNPVPFKPGDLKIFGASVTGMRALDAGNGVELFLVIDDTANCEFGARLAELRRFALSYPAVPVGVAYIHECALQVAQNRTTDRALVGKALRAPSGSAARS